MLLNNANRLQQLNRASLNLSLIKQQQNQTTSPLSNNVGVSSGGNIVVDGSLSPSILINVNDASSILTSINSMTVLPASSSNSTADGVVEVVAAPLSLIVGDEEKQHQQQTIFDSESSKTTTTTTTTTQQQQTQTTNNSSGSKKCFQLGDYILFEPANMNDTFSSAFNTKKKQFYFWKVNMKNKTKVFQTTRE